jgi:hypothetical protein
MIKNPETAAQGIKRIQKEMKNILRKTNVSIRQTMRTTAIRSRMKDIKKLQAVIDNENQGAK